MNGYTLMGSYSNSLLGCGGAVEGGDWLEKRGHYDHVLQDYLALALSYF